MKNYEQIRAANAFDACKKYKFTGDNGKSVVVKTVSTQVLENGFIGAMAFAIDKRKGYEEVFLAILEHLKSLDLGLKLPYENEIKVFFNKLVKEDSDKLRIVTAEAMAYLNYLRRFAKGS